MYTLIINNLVTMRKYNTLTDALRHAKAHIEDGYDANGEVIHKMILEQRDYSGCSEGYPPKIYTFDII